MMRQNTSWLTLTNIVLGALVILCFLFVALGSLCETIAKAKKRRSYEAELDSDLEEIFAAGCPHTATHAGALHRLMETVCRAWRRLFHRRQKREAHG